MLNFLWTYEQVNDLIIVNGLAWRALLRYSCIGLICWQKAVRDSKLMIWWFSECWRCHTFRLSRSSRYVHDKNKVARIFKMFIPFTFFGEFWPFFSNHSPFACSSARPPAGGGNILIHDVNPSQLGEAQWCISPISWSIIDCAARPSSASRYNSPWFTMSILHSSVVHLTVVARSIIGCAARHGNASRYNNSPSCEGLTMTSWINAMRYCVAPRIQKCFSASNNANASRRNTPMSCERLASWINDVSNFYKFRRNSTTC